MSEIKARRFAGRILRAVAESIDPQPVVKTQMVLSPDVVKAMVAAINSGIGGRVGFGFQGPRPNGDIGRY